ncbi:hypothetical protein AFM12_06545 [Jiulongibacter sediminis]|uniref:Uncharacterized protein n=1 Tax=Jiulongibacter sediminis TaxID=1605367 RepID=A0A0N8H9U0_9BACT|nr:hypothetical protein AFM12_06545 [Jiulongibacter sediminis]TBX24846.1 hypothetical protein TK44_06550 [Jiulongibacter sediminis]
MAFLYKKVWKSYHNSFRKGLSQPPQKRLRPVQKLFRDLIMFGFAVANRSDLPVFKFKDIRFGLGHDDGE